MHVEEHASENQIEIKMFSEHSTHEKCIKNNIKMAKD